MAEPRDEGADGARDDRRAERLARRLVWARRASQSVFFAAFLWLLFRTEFRGSFAATTERVRLDLPVEAFLYADPYAALLTLLSTHTVYRGLAWSLIVVALTVLLGRVFCGWVCPLGALQHGIAWVFPSRYGKGGRRIAQNRTHPVRQRVKYYLLYASLTAALFGSALGGILDPICLLVRSTALVVLPAGQYATLAAADAADATGFAVLQWIGNRAVETLSNVVWQREQFLFHEAWLVGLIFVGLLVVGRFIPRFWCRVLCPLGALLGLLSRFSLLGMRKDEDKCTDCNLCLLHCQGADSPQGGAAWRQDECHLCFNCQAACPEDVIHFRWLPDRGGVRTEPDTVRRTALASAAAGAVLVPILRAADGVVAQANPRLIRPPGSIDERLFLERCIRCGECMKVCPNNALHPALVEAGLEGLWTPLLIAKIGYCEQSCVLCGQVCPTGAIARIAEEHRVGAPDRGIEPVRIGTAFFDRGRCLPWAMGTPCIVCEEFCPTSPKAIWIEEAEVPARSPDRGRHGGDDRTARIRRPHLDPARCIGCGACEHVCPVRDQAAVRVTSVGETRSKTNVILL
ncbi:MAG: 4Fe-4S binding protein [Deltaproteobacteria bacterium]|jgi:polyferredoxin|nr:4Fe-4S binding protein [Deltaproteobacteria bacterium]MBW2534115.1 4Fe-4S binding protein [Deltaproteobacteria bacterium]